eukprot:TRINITY_DN217_c0_g1_i1.p1 TRINITY_DN217_c0_g1~~TRINITY_DN217_c0_g1_i1.p1  ORF type:complete len:938 (-),score=456.13 TRINITY_DN217_c0_g1_i1:187-3000(-)
MHSVAIAAVLLLVACTASVQAGPTIAQVDVSLGETTVADSSAKNLTYTFSRMNTDGEDLAVKYVINGTAENMVDYTLEQSTGMVDVTDGEGIITIPGGEEHVRLFVVPIDRDVVRDDALVEVNIVPDTAYIIGSPGVVTGTITSDDLAVAELLVAVSTVREGGQFTLRIEMEGEESTIPIPVSVQFGGTADFASDYTITDADIESFDTTTGLLAAVFEPFVTSAFIDITIDITDDSLGEDDKTIEMAVVDLGTKYELGTPSSFTVTIDDRDEQTIYVEYSPSSVVENGGENITVTFRRAGNGTDDTLSASFTLNGTAVLGTHYTFAPDSLLVGMSSVGLLEFEAGQQRINATIAPIDDAVQNADREVEIYVLDSPDYQVGTPLPATATIENDDIEVVVFVSPSSVVEASGDEMVFRFERLGIDTEELTVSFDVGGTATFNDDYEQSGADSFSASAGTVVIAAGEDVATVTVTPVEDSNVEEDETVELTVTAGTGYEVGTNATATGTIENDDQNSVSLSVNPVAVRENSGTPFTYLFTRSGDAATALTVRFSVGGTAGLSGVGGTDYVESGAATFSASEGSIVIPRSLFSATMRLTPVGDTRFEANETIVIQLQPASQYTIDTPSPVTVTIVNDDSGTSTVSLSGSPSGVFENPSTPMRVEFSRTGDKSRSLTVNFAVGGSARFGVDYTVDGANVFTDSEGNVVFTNGVSTIELDIVPVANSDVDDDRTVFLSLLSDSKYAVSSTQNSFSGTILDDDVTTVDNLEPVVTAASGAQFVAIKLREELEFPEDRQLIINLIRVDISNYLSISSSYVDVVDVYLQNVEIRIFSTPNRKRDSGLELAERLVLAINSKDAAFFGTPLDGATAFVVSNTFGDAPTFNQDFGVDPNIINDLIGSVPAEEEFYFAYYSLFKTSAAAASVPSLLAAVLCMGLVLAAYL